MNAGLAFAFRSSEVISWSREQENLCLPLVWPQDSLWHDSGWRLQLCHIGSKLRAKWRLRKTRSQFSPRGQQVTANKNVNPKSVVSWLAGNTVHISHRGWGARNAPSCTHRGRTTRDLPWDPFFPLGKFLPISFLCWRRKWQPIPVFLPGKSHGRRDLVGYSPWGRKEWVTTERLHSLHFLSLQHTSEHNNFESFTRCHIREIVCVLDFSLTQYSNRRLDYQYRLARRSTTKVTVWGATATLKAKMESRRTRCMARTKSYWKKAQTDLRRPPPSGSAGCGVTIRVNVRRCSLGRHQHNFLEIYSLALTKVPDAVPR